MCDPVQIAMFAVSTYMDDQEQKQLARQQEAANARARTAADAAFASDKEIIDRRREEEKDAAAQASVDVYRDAMEKKATANASAGESAVSGITVEAVLNQIAFQEGTVQTRNDGTYNNTINALEDDRTKSYNNLVSRYNNQGYVTQPNFLGTALKASQPYQTEANFAKVNKAIS